MIYSYSNTPIVIAFTPNYLIPAAVTIQSILHASTADEHFLFICLLSEDLPSWQVDELHKLVGARATFKFLNLKGQLSDVYVDAKYTEAANYRLMLPNLLPSYDNVLYIDCDVVVRQDLARLYRNTDLGNNYLAGVFEAPLEHQLPHMNAIGCAPGKYINSGFLIMDLALMRQDDISNKLIDALRVDYLEFPDQDALNTVCRGRIMGLPPIYNSIRTFFLPQYKSAFLQYYTEADWQQVQTSGTIHYTGGKPCNIFSVMFREWWQEYESLPESIRKRMPVNRKMQQLFKVYNNPIGRFVLDCTRQVYRAIKHTQQ